MFPKIRWRRRQMRNMRLSDDETVPAMWFKVCARD
jgi:hypothetical protein